MDIVQILLLLIGVIILIKSIIIDQKAHSKKHKKKKSYRKHKNKNFHIIPEHTDKTQEYIECIWEEIRKK